MALFHAFNMLAEQLDGFYLALKKQVAIAIQKSQYRPIGWDNSPANLVQLFSRFVRLWIPFVVVVRSHASVDGAGTSCECQQHLTCFGARVVGDCSKDRCDPPLVIALPFEDDAV